jgi:glycosyltransferase involved in cell wall biosynthesis
VRPRISIITPSYNQGKYIERTIQSVLSQNMDGLEYIVIDGGSTDETISILRRYEDKLYWISEKDKGHSDGINKGIIRSSAPIVGWLNSDDIYYPGALQAVLACFESHPETDVVYGDAYHIDENDVIIERYPAEEWNWERLKDVCFISQPATFLRRRVFDQYGLLDINFRYSMDYEYWLRLGKNRVHFTYLPQILAATRLHEEAFTVSKRVECHKAINDLTRQHLGKTPDRWIFSYAHYVVERRGFRSANRLRFAVVLSIISVYASLWWNRRVSWNMLRTIARWIGGNTLITLRGVFTR